LSGFANTFYTFKSEDEVLTARKEALSGYMTEELINLNADLIKADTDVNSALTDFKLWKIEQLEDKHMFKLTYSVQQSINKVVIEMKTEKVQVKEAGKIVTKEVEKPDRKDVYESALSCYSVVLYVSDDGNMVIIQNPTVAAIPQKAEYKAPDLTADGSVGGEESKEITQFLETFFALYPTADKTTLGYYATADVLPVLNRNYEFVELTKKVYKKVDGKVTAYVTVNYHDEVTGLNQLSQYCLALEKKDKWLIAGNSVG